MSRNPFLSSDITEELDELDSTNLPNPEDILPECKQGEVPSTLGAINAPHSKTTPATGQKRTWTEKASPECNVGDVKNWY